MTNAGSGHGCQVVVNQRGQSQTCPADRADGRAKPGQVLFSSCLRTVNWREFPFRPRFTGTGFFLVPLYALHAGLVCQLVPFDRSQFLICPNLDRANIETLPPACGGLGGLVTAVHNSTVQGWKPGQPVAEPVEATQPRERKGPNQE